MREIDHVKSLYPRAHFVGIADGAKSNWDFLGSHIDLKSAEFSVIFVNSGWSLAHQLADLRARKKGISQRMGTV